MVTIPIAQRTPSFFDSADALDCAGANPQSTSDPHLHTAAVISYNAHSFFGD